jgi:hypothetical protein
MADDRGKREFSMADSDSERPQDSERRGEADGLPFTVELGDPVAGARVLARAATASLARAMFVAACTEYPDRRLLLKRGKAIIQDTAASS